MKQQLIFLVLYCKEDLDSAFVGKFYINDFETLISDFSYPYWTEKGNPDEPSAKMKPDTPASYIKGEVYSRYSPSLSDGGTSLEELYNFILSIDHPTTKQAFENIVKDEWLGEINFFTWLF